MDNIHQHFTTKFSLNAPKTAIKVSDAGVSYSAVTALQMDRHGVSTSCINSNRNKRKLRVIDGLVNLQDDSALVLELGCSSSSCITISSGKEIDENSIDLGLKVNYDEGNGKSKKTKNISGGAPRVVEFERPKLDLELTLSIGTAESDIKSITQGVCPFENNADSPIKAGTVQLVDEGSTSSRWKLRPVLPSMHSSHCIQKTSLFNHFHGHVNSAPIIPDFPSTAADTPKSSAVGASGVIHQFHRCNTSVKICQFEGCIKGARGASGLCIAHGGGRRCMKPGCLKGAEGKTVFCKAHGGGQRCQHLGCTRSAEGCTDYCIGHGGGSRCNHEGCTHAARGKSGLCIRHGGGKRCKIENCTKSAEGIASLCISHGGGRRCQYPACAKGAQGSTMFCKAHGGGKRCTFLGCTKGAEGSTLFCKGHGGGKRCAFEGGCTRSVHGGTSFCVNHGGGKRCAVPECTKSARGRTNFCVRHGGGKRCKFEGCGKSAQGRTDFCKAHGGGKRCSWGQLASEYSSQADAPCDKFSRGKSGLCAAHSTQVHDKRIHGGPLGHTVQAPQYCIFDQMVKGTVTTENINIGGIKTGGIDASIDLMGSGHQLISGMIPSQKNVSAGNASLVHFSLPEGRVHGGSLMTVLKGSIGFGAN